MAGSDEVVCYENKANNKNRVSYVKENKPGPLKQVVGKATNSESLLNTWKSVFLPRGYPHSVSKDYLTYQLWDTLQAFCSSITSTLAAEAVLKGIGVGNKDATLLAATITWLLKDGTGMVGRILFAWIKGSFLDSDCKKWRLFADILNDVSIMMDLLSPVFQSYFILVSCLSGVCRSIVGVTGSATRAALTQHQARHNNMADVSAKDGSQETLVNLMALITSLILVPLISGNQVLIWILFMIFTALHIFSNYMAVKSVVMETINLSRFCIIARHYLKHDEIPTVERANFLEVVLPLPFVREEYRFNVGCQMSQVTRDYETFKELRQIFSDYSYLINFEVQRAEINIALQQGITFREILQSCFHAELIWHLAMSKYGEKHTETNFALKILNESVISVDDKFENFISKAMVKGWNTEVNLINDSEWRFSFDV